MLTLNIERREIIVVTVCPGASMPDWTAKCVAIGGFGIGTGTVAIPSIDNEFIAHLTVFDAVSTAVPKSLQKNEFILKNNYKIRL